MNKQDFVIISIIGGILMMVGGTLVYLRFFPENIKTQSIKSDTVSNGSDSVPSPQTTEVQSQGEEVAIPREQERTLEERLIADPDSLPAELTDVTGGSSSGTAYILRKNGQLFHTVTARLPEPTGGEFYEGWLVKQFPRLSFFSTGKMKLLNNGQYFLTFNADEEYPEFDQVVITIEKDDDSNPERHVLEGTAQR